MEALRVKAVILAGGLGTRMRPYTLFVPKPMLPLGDRPVLEHLIEWLKTHGVKDLAICVGYLRRIIEDYFEDGKEQGVKITYIRTHRPMGTAGQLKSAEGYVNETFICVYGDSVFDFDLRKVVQFHKSKKALATICVMPYKATSKYGFIDVDKNGLVNIGCYMMEPSFFKYIPPNVMFGMDIAFQRALEAGKPMYGYKVKGEFMDIGDRKAYTSAYEKYLSRLGRIL